MTQNAAKYDRFAGGSVGLRRFRSGSQGAPNAVCFPYAGGQSLGFRDLAGRLPSSWGVWGIDPPGHGWAGGTPLERVDAMVETYLEHLPPGLFDGAILLGHSLGGYVVYALAERLSNGRSRPRGIVMSGTRPPHRRDDYDSFLELDDQTLLDCLIELGGVPAQWSREPQLFDHFKDTIRADFRAFESYETPAPLEDVPALILGGMHDVVCRPEHVVDWSRFCPGCRVELINGGHMFLQTHAAAVAERMVAFARSLGGLGSDGGVGTS